MNDLIEKLGAEDEDNYIYLDKDGNAQLCLELILKWNLLPNKKFALTCSADDSLGYLRTKICELMEKYPIFSGLHGLSSENLSNSKGQLPTHGTVGQYLKTGEIVNFDLDSKDIWLDIQVECQGLALVIFFEARVNKVLRIETFIQYLVEIINQILKMKKIDMRYEKKNVKLNKMHLGDSSITVKNLKSSVLGQGNMPSYLKNIEKNSVIEDVFDYLERAVLAELEKNEGDERKMNVSELTSEMELKLLDCSMLPIRSLRVEEKKVMGNENRPHHRKGNYSEMNSKVCSCDVF